MLDQTIIVDTVKSVVKHFEQLDLPVDFNVTNDHSKHGAWWSLLVEGPDIEENSSGEQQAVFYVRLILTIRNVTNVYAPYSHAASIFPLLTKIAVYNQDNQVVGCLVLDPDSSIVFEGFGKIKSDAQVMQPSVEMAFVLK